MPLGVGTGQRRRRTSPRVSPPERPDSLPNIAQAFRSGIRGIFSERSFFSANSGLWGQQSLLSIDEIQLIIQLATRYDSTQVLRPDPVIMRSPSIALLFYTLLLGALAVSGLSFKQLPVQQLVQDDKLAVPGTNPLGFCATPDDYILEIAYVDLDPNPPEKGKPLTIKATGNVTEEIVEGAYANIVVKLKLNYGGQIPILTRKGDICALLANDDDIDQKCPVDKDKDITISKSVHIPAQVPPGKYVVLIDAYTIDEEKITCMQTEIAF